MNGISTSDAARTRLRTAVTAMEGEIARLPAQAGRGLFVRRDLASAWADLVELLALGPEPELRACPLCGHVGMRAATLCANCWTGLTPPAGPDGATG